MQVVNCEYDNESRPVSVTCEDDGEYHTFELCKKKGKWIASEYGYPDRIITCSLCGFEYDSADYNSPKFEQRLFNFCPNCGHPMKGGIE